MSYIYGKRGTCKETALTAAIRQELYVQDYSNIDWNAARNQCAEPDLYYPHPKVSSPAAMTFSLEGSNKLLSEINAQSQTCYPHLKVTKSIALRFPAGNKRDSIIPMGTGTEKLEGTFGKLSFPGLRGREEQGTLCQA